MVKLQELYECDSHQVIETTDKLTQLEIKLEK